MNEKTTAPAPKRFTTDGARVLDTETGLMAPTFEERTAKQLMRALNKRHVKPEQIKWHEVAK